MGQAPLPRPFLKNPLRVAAGASVLVALLAFVAGWRHRLHGPTPRSGGAGSTLPVASAGPAPILLDYDPQLDLQSEANRKALQKMGPTVPAKPRVPKPQRQYLEVRQRTAALYARVLRTPPLAPEQVARATAILTEGEFTLIDILGVAGRERLDFAAAKGYAEAERANLDSQLREVIGEAAYQDYLAFRQAIPEYATLDQLETRMAGQAEPLTPAQEKALVGILQLSQGDLLMSRSPGSVALTRRVSDGAIAQATTLLTPAQLTALRFLQEAQKSTPRVVDVLPPTAPAGK